ncbi:MAG: S8 family serine peptidase [Chloroflexus sp.]
MNRTSLWRIGLTLLLASSLFGLATITSADDNELVAGYIADEVILKLFHHSDLTAVANQYHLGLPPLDQFGTRPIYRLRILDGVDAQVKADIMASDGRIEYAEPNYLLETPEAQRGRRRWVIGGDAGTFAAQWSTSVLRLSQAHQMSQGAGVTVAVLDTGVDLSHPVLAGRLMAGFDFVDFDAVPQEEGTATTNPAYGHGTHVAGIIALVAPAARIMPVRVLDAEGVGNSWVLAEGLRYATDPDGNPATNDGAQVINLSLGTLRPTALVEELLAELACDDDDDDNDDCAYGHGIVVVAAAGNSGDSTPHYPAAEQASNLLAVAATTATDTLAEFSTRGPWVTISAPGDQIVSTVPGGQYGTWSGTSMAAPHVAGVVALVRTQRPSLPADQVVQHVVSTAQPIASPAPVRINPLGSLDWPVGSSSSGMMQRAFIPLVTR